MTTQPTKFYLAVPLGVLRRFVEMNKDYEDDFLQMFEIIPQMIFTQSQLEQSGALKSNGTVIVDLTKLGDNNAN